MGTERNQDNILHWLIKPLRTVAKDESDYAVAAVIESLGRLSLFEMGFRVASLVRHIAKDPLKAADMLVSALLKQVAAEPEAHAVRHVEEVIDGFHHCPYGVTTKTSRNEIQMRIIAFLTRYLASDEDK